MSEELTEEQKQTIKSAFVMFADNEQEDGTVSANQLGTLVRAIGKNPTEADIEEMKKEINMVRESAPKAIAKIESEKSTKEKTKTEEKNIDFH